MSGIYWLASYPKSGNTWFRAFLCNLLQDGNEPVNINALSTGTIASSRPALDDVLCFDSSDLNHDEIDRLRPAAYRWMAKEDEPQYLKIHDAYTRTVDGEPLVSHEGTRGALYIVRNPLDVAVSAANHWNCSIDRAIENMANVDYAACKKRRGLPNQLRHRLGSWSSHVTSWVDAPDLSCEVVRYEDMLTNPLSTFARAACFLALPNDPDRLDKAIRFSTFEQLADQEKQQGFSERPSRAPEQFFRRGRSGDWREKLDPAQVDRIVSEHAKVMRRFGYLDAQWRPT